MKDLAHQACPPFVLSLLLLSTCSSAPARSTEPAPLVQESTRPAINPVDTSSLVAEVVPDRPDCRQLSMRFSDKTPFAEATLCRHRRHNFGVFDYPIARAVYRSAGPHPYLEVRYADDGATVIEAFVRDPETGRPLIEKRANVAQSSPWEFSPELDKIATCPEGADRIVELPSPKGLSSAKFLSELLEPVVVHCEKAGRSFRVLALWPNGTPMLQGKTFSYPDGARAMEVDKVGESGLSGLDLRALRCWAHSGELRQCRPSEPHEWIRRGVWPVRDEHRQPDRELEAVIRDSL